MLDGACGEPDAGPTRTSGSGGRHEETGREQSRNRASCRPHHDVALIDEHGVAVARSRIDTGAAGFSALLALIAEHGGGVDDTPVAVETDKNLIVVALVEAGFTVYPINPRGVARYRERYGQAGAKSDPGDAAVLAHILRTDRHLHRQLPTNTNQAGAIKVLARQHQEAI